MLRGKAEHGFARRRARRAVLLVCSLGYLTALTILPGPLYAAEDWQGTWQMSPAGLPSAPKVGTFTLPPSKLFKGTVRYRLRVSAAGKAVRVRFSNEYGATALHLSAASVGRATAASGTHGAVSLDAEPGTLRRLTFGGASSIAIPAGAPVLSDPVTLDVPALGDLIVSAYVTEGLTVTECRADLAPPNQVGIESVDATAQEHLLQSECLLSRPLASEVEVRGPHARRVIVTLGDSITDGAIDPVSGDRGWPGRLARRLAPTGGAVVNAGIGGNQLLSDWAMFGVSALARFDRDVLAVPGRTDLILLEGINDIGQSGPGAMLGDKPLIKPEALIAALSQLAARAHAQGLHVYGCTLLPFEGANYYSEEKERVRTALNAWIRRGEAFDGVIDFDAALRQSADPRRLRAEYDSGDHLHPSPAGYRAMGDVIDLRWFLGPSNPWNAD